MTRPKLSRPELLERAVQRAERYRAAHPDDVKADAEAEQLAIAVRALNDELAIS